MSTKVVSIGPRGHRGPARISAFYAPPAEMTETLYQVLGIPEGGSAGASDIKRAYKQMARKYHPDVSPPGRVDEYTRRFIMVHEAYETLSDPQGRASYDRDLAGGFHRNSHDYHYHQVYIEGNVVGCPNAQPNMTLLLFSIF